MQAAGRRQLGSDQVTSLPIYHQLYVQLRHQLKDQPPSDVTPFPSEPALARLHAVSRVTVRKALAMLERDGLVVRRKGVGTFAINAVAANRLREKAGSLVTVGPDTTAETLAWDRAALPPAYAAKALQLASGQTCLRVDRLRLHQGERFSLVEVYVPPPYDGLVAEAEIGERPVMAFLEGKGVVACSAEQTISATGADMRTADLLGLAPGAPLIVLSRTVYDDAGATLLFQRGRYLPERYEYHMEFSLETMPNRPAWRQID